MRTSVLFFLLCLPQLTLEATIAVNTGVSVNGNTSDQVAWKDSSGLTRSAAIVQLNGASTAGKVGGYLTQIVYNDGAGNVTCNESGYGVDGTLSGLGQMVNHGGTGNGWVSSNQDGIKAGATTQVLFQGANHVIYQVDMDEYGDNGDTTKGTWHDRWIYMFSTGHDYFVESISYDFSNHIAGYWGYAGGSGQTAHDSRSPYCSFNWTGTGAANTLTESIDGIEWAARDSGTNSYIFKTIGSSPFSSGYTYNTAASNIPYTLQWKNAPDREIGYVSTFDLTQFAAGEGFTSQCAIGSTSASMPANWGVNYQSNGFQGWMGDKMTWGVPYGAAGGTTGSSTFPDWTYARNWTGYPTMGYTLQIQMGKHSADGVHKQVAEQAAIHALPSTALTAAVGTVVTTGKMNLQDPASTFTFKPQGFNHIYNAWQVTCAGNAADVTLALGAATLKNPTFIFDNYNLASLCQLTLNGTTQVEGTDMYTSLDTVNKKLYVTFNANFTGNERIVIFASCGSPTFTPTITATPTLGAASFTPTPVVGGSGKSYCLTVDYSGLPALLNYRKVTLNVNVGNCSSVTVTENGSPVSATYNSGTGIATFTVSSAAASSSVVVTAVNWTSGGTGVATKANLYNNFHWAFSQTFDDGYSSVITYGKPILDAHGWRAGEAFTGSFVGQTWGYDAALGANETLMTTAQYQALRAAGWDIFNHTWDHPNLTCANFQTEFDQNQTLALSIFPGYHLSHIVYPFENSAPAQSACPGFPPSYLISGEQNTDTYNFVDVPVPGGFRGNPLGNVYAAARSGNCISATYGNNIAHWESVANAAATNARPTWLINICHRVYPANTLGNDPDFSNNVTNLTAYYNYLDSNYGTAGGNNSMWVAPSGEVMDYLMARDNLVVTSFSCGTPTFTPTVCGACTSTSTASPSPSFSATPTASPVPACGGNSLDDMEDNNTTNSWGGYWSIYAGSAPATANPSPFVMTAPGHVSSYCARLNGTGNAAGPPSVSTNLNAGGTGVNVSAYQGVSFWFKGDGNQVRFQIHSVVDPSYNDYKYDFTPPVGWSYVNVPFASLSFPGWGPAYSMDLAQVIGITWAPLNAGAYDFSVDDVQFMCPVPTATSTSTLVAGSPTSTRTPSPSATASRTPTFSPTRTSSATASSTVTSSSSPTVSGTRTASPSPSSSATVSGSPTVTPSFSASPSVTPSFTDVPPGSTLTNTPLATFTRTSTPTGSDTATSSMTPSSTVTPTSSGTATVSATSSCTATPLPGSPTFTSTPTQSQTTVSTLPATFSATPSSTSTLTPSSTSAAPVSTFTPTDTRTMTPTYTTTLVVVVGTATNTPVNSATATSANGPLEILQVVACPNPNPGQISVQLSGPAEDVEFRLFSVAETVITVLHSGPVHGGWSQVALPLTTFDSYPNGLFYVRAVARQAERRSLPSKPIRLVVLR